MAEIVLLIISGILSILYGLAIHQNIKLEDRLEIEEYKNIKLEDERDIETFEKNKLERENKRLKSDEHRRYLIQKIIDKNKRIALLCSKVQNREKIIDKLRKNENKI